MGLRNQHMGTYMERSRDKERGRSVRKGRIQHPDQAKCGEESICSEDVEFEDTSEKSQRPGIERGEFQLHFNLATQIPI